MARDVYQAVTDRILEMLDQGTVPWRQPIKRTAHGDGFPKSLSTGHRYRGLNVFLLAMTAWAKGYQSTYWATFHQVQERSGHVKKGEKSSLVVFWKQYNKTDRETGEETTLHVARCFNVFNVEQCEGVTAPDQLPIEEALAPFEPLAECERIVSGYPNPPQIEHAGHRACYIPRLDKVMIARPEHFESRESYYATLFHELGHSTGHATRLAPESDSGPNPFGSPDYGREELVAELTSAFLCATGGISPPTIEQSAAYIAGWRKAIQGDQKLVIQAASQAQRAADHILGVTFDDAPPSAAEDRSFFPPPDGDQQREEGPAPA